VKVCGIDLAGNPKNKTGICILVNLTARTFIVYQNHEIINLIKKEKPKLIAIDAPLSMPKNGKLRSAEIQLRKIGIRAYPPLIKSMESLTKGGILLKKKLEKIGFRVLETYPGGAQDILKIPRKKNKDGLINRLKNLGIKFDKKITHHELDAITAAYVARLELLGKTSKFGNKKEGEIVLPKVSN